MNKKEAIKEYEGKLSNLPSFEDYPDIYDIECGKDGNKHIFKQYYIGYGEYDIQIAYLCLKCGIRGFKLYEIHELPYMKLGDDNYDHLYATKEEIEKVEKNKHE